MRTNYFPWRPGGRVAVLQQMPPLCKSNAKLRASAMLFTCPHSAAIWGYVLGREIERAMRYPASGFPLTLHWRAWSTSAGVLDILWDVSAHPPVRPPLTVTVAALAAIARGAVSFWTLVACWYRCWLFPPKCITLLTKLVQEDSKTDWIILVSHTPKASYHISKASTNEKLPCLTST